MPLLSDQDVEKVIVTAFGSNFKISSYSFEPFNESKRGSFGSHSLLKVNVTNKHGSDSDCEEKSLTFFVKTPPESVLTQNLMGIGTFEEEINFYKNIKPLMLSNCDRYRWAPKCYLAENNVLVFEDLRAQGFSSISKRLMDERFMKSALTSLARFHASSLLAEEKLGKPLNEAFPKFLLEKNFDDSTKLGQITILSFQTVVQIADKLNLDANFVFPHMYDYLQQRVKPKEGELNVLCHNDLWNNNFLFNQKDLTECVIVDYQLLRYCTPAADISMILFLNTTSEFRRQYEYDMLSHYYSIFEETLDHKNVKIKIPSYESMLKTYKECRLLGMALAAFYLPLFMLEPAYLMKLVSDPELFERYMIRDRMEFIGPYLDKSPAYAEKIKALLCELFDEAKLVLNL